MLDIALIEGELLSHGIDLCGRIFIYDITDSTNRAAKEYIRGGGALPALFIAREQSMGRGRLGRSFHSARGGLYMTYAEAVDFDGLSAGHITALAGVAVLRAIRSLCALDTDIKWVNDIYCRGKKLCGILAEGVSRGGQRLDAVAVGIGVNVSHTDMPEELADIAASLSDMTERVPSTSALAAEIIHSYLACRRAPILAMEDYKSRSMVLRRRVSIPAWGTEALVKDILPDGSLLILLDSGEEKMLAAGEVSIRPI